MIKIIKKINYKIPNLKNGISLDMFEVHCSKCKQKMHKDEVRFVNNGKFKSRHWGWFELKTDYKESQKIKYFKSKEFHKEYKRYGPNLFLLETILFFVKDDVQRNRLRVKFEKNLKQTLIDGLKYLNKKKVELKSLSISLNFDNTLPTNSMLSLKCNCTKGKKELESKYLNNLSDLDREVFYDFLHDADPLFNKEKKYEYAAKKLIETDTIKYIKEKEKRIEKEKQEEKEDLRKNNQEVYGFNDKAQSYYLSQSTLGVNIKIDEDNAFMYEGRKEGEADKDWVAEEEKEIKEGRKTPKDWK